jgi:nucleotide-binding universal stress UspA family protein
MVKRKKPDPSSGPRAQDNRRFRHILVPTDLTERTEKALQLASKLASSDRARITLLHVIETIVSYATANGVDLIVLASHRVNPSMVNRDWGTISYKVGILAQCPVLLVK